MGYKKVRAASPLRRSRFLVCLAPSPTYLGRVFWCAFKPLAPRLGKKMQPWKHSGVVAGSPHARTAHGRGGDGDAHVHGAWRMAHGAWQMAYDG